MSANRLGLVLEGLGEPVKDALRSVARLAFRELELPATFPEIDPARLSRTGRRDLQHYLGELGLRLSALGGDLGGARFTDGGRLEERLGKTRQIMELAAELRVPVVTSHLGPVNELTLKSGLLQQALGHLAEVADRTGTVLAFETASADPVAVAGLLRNVNSPALAACYDPGSLLIDGMDPLAGVAPLADRIVIARIRDAVGGTGQRAGRETAIGQGQLDVPAYLGALEEAGYRSIPFLRRTQSEHPIQELVEAKRRLGSLLG